MKACPYCAEEIQPAAIKCRYCGHWLATPPPSVSAPAGRRSADGRAFAIAEIAVACLVIASAFLPWYGFPAAAFGLAFSGWQAGGYGKLVVLAGAGAAVLGILRLTLVVPAMPCAIVATAAGSAAAAAAIVAIVNALQLQTFGVYVALMCAVALAAVGVVDMTRSRRA